jgi:hypothetical protein
VRGNVRRIDSLDWIPHPDHPAVGQITGGAVGIPDAGKHRLKSSSDEGVLQ